MDNSLPQTPPPAPLTPVAPTITPLTMPPLNSAGGNSKQNKKVIAGVLGVVLLTIGAISGFLVIMRPVLFNSSAWDCGAYAFAMTQDGVVTVSNGSAEGEPLQRAEVYINNTLVETFDVPALAAGANATLGSVTTPDNTFTWQVKGVADCSNSGRYEQNQVVYQCQQIKAFNLDGTELTASDLSQLDAGATIQLVAIGTGSATNYKAVRFTVNGALQPESTQKRVATGDFYDEYTLPASTNSFTITAQLQGVDNAWY